MGFTKNEKEVLKLLLYNARASDVSISKKLKVSTQAVGKIRKKLEKQGVIKGYCCMLDFEKIGLNSFALIYLKIVSKTVLRKRETSFDKKRIEKMAELTTRVIALLEPLESEYDYIVLEGFRSQRELEEYLRKLRIAGMGVFEIKKVDSFSVHSFLKLDIKGVSSAILDEAAPRPPIPEILKLFKI